MNAALGIHMNLDELANSVPESELREKLLHWVGEWKKDDQDVEALGAQAQPKEMERYP